MSLPLPVKLMKTVLVGGFEVLDPVWLKIWRDIFPLKVGLAFLNWKRNFITLDHKEKVDAGR